MIVNIEVPKKYQKCFGKLEREGKMIKAHFKIEENTQDFYEKWYKNTQYKTKTFNTKDELKQYIKNIIKSLSNNNDYESYYHNYYIRIYDNNINKNRYSEINIYNDINKQIDLIS